MNFLIFFQITLVFIFSNKWNGKVYGGSLKKHFNLIIEKDSNNSSRNFLSGLNDFDLKDEKNGTDNQNKTNLPSLVNAKEMSLTKIITIPACLTGYAADENGTCQKMLDQPLKKNFDFDRKRKRRHVDDDEMMNRKSGKPFVKRLDFSFPYWKLLEKLKGKNVVDCNKVYSGLVSDGVDACKKSASFSGFYRS